MKTYLTQLRSPVVFCHNVHINISFLKGWPKLMYCLF
jgi:hypothetical protein